MNDTCIESTDWFDGQRMKAESAVANGVGVHPALFY
jgi:hypothetical protein